ERGVRRVRQGRPGKGTILRADHADTGLAHLPDYSVTLREWTCPPDYALVSCTAEHGRCSDGTDCSGADFRAVATVVGNGCRFACTGPRASLTRAFCQF